jgi:uncharacterized metal-binding protein YceD (DUF177 family)
MSERGKTGDRFRDASADVRAAWSVPVQVAEVPETGRHVELEADAATRQAVAKTASVVALPRLHAEFDLTPLPEGGLRVNGAVSAIVEQNCVVTLEPVTTEVHEPVDLTFLPPGEADAAAQTTDDVEPPEAFEGETVDLGAVATEFLILGIDPYPRKPGVSFEAPAAPNDPAAHPFAALAALKGQNGS